MTSRQRLVEILGDPETCPHGNFIPGPGRAPVPATVLSDALVGQRVRLARISEIVELDMDTLVYLEEHGFIPGSEALVVARGPDGTLVLQAEESAVVLGAHLAKLLYFTPVGAKTGAAPPERPRAKLQLLS